jgi:uncharacterized protein
MTEYRVTRDDDAGRWELCTDDGSVVGYADFQVVGSTVVMPHTVINPSMRGHGLGAELVRGALDDVRHDGRRVDAQCWYVRQFIDQNRQYQDLLADR